MERIERELAEVQEKNRGVTATWEEEKKDLEAIKNLRGEIERSTSSSTRASVRAIWRRQRDPLRRVRELEKQLSDAESRWAKRVAKGWDAD